MQRVCQWDKERRAKARENRPPRCTADNMTRPYEYSTARMSQFIAGESACIYESIVHTLWNFAEKKIEKVAGKLRDWLSEFC